jgi:hypothetical protein
MSDIYVILGGLKQGPFSEDQVTRRLKSGDLTTNLLAWRDGDTDTIPLGLLVKKGLPEKLVAEFTMRPPSKTPQLLFRVFKRTLRIAIGLVGGSFAVTWCLAKAFKVLGKPFAALPPVEFLGGIFFVCLGIAAFVSFILIAFGRGETRQ